MNFELEFSIYDFIKKLFLILVVFLAKDLDTY